MLKITTLFSRIANLRVAVIGDFALDLYATVETQTGERSIETGQTVFWGRRPRASLGGAGNVVQNLATLGVGDIRVAGCVGDDLFGREMRQLFGRAGVDTTHLHTPEGWDTCVYAKPFVNGQEANRLDFGTHNALADADFQKLLDALASNLPNLDLLIINQQFPNPLLTASRTEQLNSLLERFPTVCCVADMRDMGHHISHATLKVNTAELARLLHTDLPAQPDYDWCVRAGQQLSQHRNGPVVLTRGEAGILYVNGEQTESVEAVPLRAEIDTVGAGDTVVAAFGACVGTGASPADAIDVANLAAAVTVQKLRQTGTASLEEILALLYDTEMHGGDTEIHRG
ncbi:bifunctional heptose 7-phosphate kinase/heptose 1-phosphate adenyltransferase [Spirosoma montaniterrae]|uniref:Carbohydrate kinase n=1 Tax=Spirosoma montaniterrae TaxID=1178516 RepID=A0A1P9WX25_9BACT|nr:PfkB family carbohydrate kinase [Spirosoma montaniterrae]AQG79936.1 carbohydrate kinase [Spirosoma montaniterrae]